MHGPAGKALDRGTRIVLLLGGRDQVFQLLHRFPEPLASTRRFEVRRFCHYSLLSEAPMRVTDARGDDNLRILTGVVELGVVAYLGIPLKPATGEMVRSMCAVDFQSHHRTAGEVVVLQELAASALREVELRMPMIEHERLMETLTTHLRDPLTIVQLNVDLFEDSTTEQERSERISRIRAACARMGSGVRQCLHANRAGSMSEPA